jgi:hypothetical protein
MDGWLKWTAVPFTKENFKLVLNKEVQNFQCLKRKSDLFPCQIDNSLKKKLDSSLNYANLPTLDREKHAL